MQIPVIFLAFVIASCVAQNWEQISGEANYISAKGEELWVIEEDDRISRFTHGKWEHIPGSAVGVGASPDGWTWGVNKYGDTFRWNFPKRKWEQIPGNLVQISAMSKDRAMGVNRAGNIYLYENGAWVQMPGAGTCAAIGDGDERWMIDREHNTCRWNHQRNAWEQMQRGGSGAVYIDVQSPCRVIMTDAANKIFTWENNNWKPITGACTKSTINYKHYYCVNKNNEIWIGK